MSIKMINDYVLIKLNEAVTVSKGGIVLTNVVEPPCVGTIISVGEGKVLNNGQRAEHNMLPGDTVVFGKASLNQPLKDEDDGSTYYVMRIEDIFWETQLMRLLPFCMFPAHWGLKGKKLEHAKIDFYMTDPYEAETARAKLVDDVIESKKQILRIEKKYGKIENHDYELQMIKLNDELISERDYKKRELEIRKKYNLLTEREFMEGEIELLPDGKEKELLVLALLYKFHEISEDEYNKQVYTLNDKVWWKLILTSDPEGQVDVVLDYNDLFVKELSSNGHPGNNEDEIVDFYVKDLGRKLATGESDDYDSRLIQANLDDPKMIIHGISNGDGTIDYS